jgi:4a-hydroxytetrahydrobiopterin dehydratase
MDLGGKHCVPCENGAPAFSEEQENEYLINVKDWILLRDGEHKLRRQFLFGDFKQAIEFVNKIAEIAEAEQHHPDIYIFYNKVQVDLFTHAVGGLSENDFIMAAKISSIAS